MSKIKLNRMWKIRFWVGDPLRNKPLFFNGGPLRLAPSSIKRSVIGTMYRDMFNNKLYVKTHIGWIEALMRS